MAGGAARTCENPEMRKSWKRMLGVGVVAATAYTVWRAFEHRRALDGGGEPWEAQPFPYPPQPRLSSVPDPPWVDAVDGACPADHPVKAKLASGIFHLPGGAFYDRTKADRCYTSAEAAAADDLRPAQR
jgi:hypothetical protein